MLLQQSAQLGVVRSQGSLCIIHTAMIVDREDVRQAVRPGPAYATAVEDAREKRTLQVRAEYLAEMRRNVGLTQGEVAEAMGVTQ